MPRAASTPIGWLALVGVVVAAGGFLLARSRSQPNAEAPVGNTIPLASDEPTPKSTPPDERRSQPITTEPREPSVWAVVIGIEQYRDVRIPPCHGASGDARAVAAWLTETAGWDRSHILLMDDSGMPDLDEFRRSSVESLLPTRNNLTVGVKEWLDAKAVRPGDVVVLYFAGQSAPISSGDGKTGTGVLLPIDARESAKAESGWSPEDLIAKVTALGIPEKPVQVVCWLDTSLTGRGEAWGARPAPGSSATWLGAIARWPGVTAWLAADGMPSAEATKLDQRSPFTNALLKGLGKASRPSNLLACINAMRHDPHLIARGFLTVGGVSPDFGLWPSWIRRTVDTPPELLLQRGHAGSIQSLAVTPDGTRLITASDDSTVRLWRLPDRTLTSVLSSHLIGVTALSLRGDGRLLASGDGNGRVRFWDLTRHIEVETAIAHQSRVDDLAILPEGSSAVSLDIDGHAYFWTFHENTQGFFEASKPVLLSSTTSALAVAHEPDPPVSFVLADAGRHLRVFDAEGKPGRSIDVPEGEILGRRLATDGQYVVAGGRNGQLRLWNLNGQESANPIVVSTSAGAVEEVVIGPGPRIAAIAGETVVLVTAPEKSPSPIVHTLKQNDAFVHLVMSSDGRWLTATRHAGAPLVARLDIETPEWLKMPGATDNSGEFQSAVFLPDGRGILAGSSSGSIEGWSLPAGEPLFSRIPGRRGRVTKLSISSDKRFLLQITREGDAHVWDLASGRTLTRIDGSWFSGVLTPDGERVVLTSLSGELTVRDRATGRSLPIAFERPEKAGTGCRFGPITLDRSSQYVAAGTIQHGPLGPIVCQWELATGKLIRTITGHEEPHALTALDFNPDASRLLTASEDGTARVWDLSSNVNVTTATPLATFRVAEHTDDPPVAVFAACFDPSDPRFVVTGSVDGRVQWWGIGRDRPLETAGTLDHAVAAVVVSPDGRRIVAGGGDKELHLWEVTRNGDQAHPNALPTVSTAPVRWSRGVQHAEQVNALLAWSNADPKDTSTPGDLIVASGSDDTTIRLWKLGDRSLLGTLSAGLEEAPNRPGPRAQPRASWIVYTPDGRFDCAVDAERQVTWRRHDEVLPLEQYYETAHLFGLSDRLRLGDRPDPLSYPSVPPARLAIDRPAQSETAIQEAELTIHVGNAGVENLRLYQNGVPIAGESDLKLTPDHARATIRVRLAPGANRFYAMASRPGAIDGRSNEIGVVLDAPESSGGRIHILALGVSEYSPEARALKFASTDAESLSGFLHRSQPELNRGARVVLTDNHVNEQQIVEGFLQIRDADLQPDDTVVVFLAGHTGTRRERYYLLLPPFSFPSGAIPTGELREVRSENALPYSVVYDNLARLRCLNRLMIVDACQAEAVLDDPAVSRVAQVVDDAAHRARTAYILAARRGEPANESSQLKHGLLTYTLLKGIGANLETPQDVTVLNDWPNADDNNDHVVTTAELGRYANITLPKLSSGLTLLSQRAGGGLPNAGEQPQRPRILATDLNFPLIKLDASNSR